MGLLGISIYISPVKFVFYSDVKPGSLISTSLQQNASLFDFEGYYNEKQRYTDVEHYTLKFELLPEEEILKGDVTIKGNLKAAVDKIHLNFYDNFKIESVTINGKEADYKNSGTALTVSNYDKAENFVIRVIYSGKPVELGFGSFVFGEFNGSSVVYTLSEPNYASTWFPCNDLAADKAFADIYITNDSSKVSVSNGLLHDVQNNGGKKTYHWKTVYPVSTYLICINSADYKTHNQTYESITGDTLNLTYYSFSEDYEKAKIDMEDHPEYLKFMETVFGEYPFLKEKYGVAEFLWGSGAMEHQTITGFSYRYYTGKKYFSDILVHELAHQWWGNAVGPASWKDVWLNEGFAKYTEALYREYSRGKNALQSTMQMIYGDFNNGTLYNPGKNLFSSKVYNKGAWVLHMLRKEVGDRAFFKILKKYYKKFKYRNASTEDFKKVCEEISGKNLEYFFKQWLFEGSGILVLRYNWQFDEDKNIKLSLRQIQTGFENYHFPVDVLVKGENKDELQRLYISSKDTTVSFQTSIKPNIIKLDPEGWLLAHIWEEKE